VIEVLEDVRREPEVVAGCRRLVDSGYRLALDDYVWEQDDPLLALVSIVKLDVLALTPAQLEYAVSQRCGLDLQLVAEKVETRQQLDDCQEMGFDSTRVPPEPARGRRRPDPLPQPGHMPKGDREAVRPDTSARRWKGPSRPTPPSAIGSYAWPGPRLPGALPALEVVRDAIGAARPAPATGLADPHAARRRRTGLGRDAPHSHDPGPNDRAHGPELEPD